MLSKKKKGVLEEVQAGGCSGEEKNFRAALKRHRCQRAVESRRVGGCAQRGYLKSGTKKSIYWKGMTLLIKGASVREKNGVASALRPEKRTRAGNRCDPHLLCGKKESSGLEHDTRRKPEREGESHLRGETRAGVALPLVGRVRLWESSEKCATIYCRLSEGSRRGTLSQGKVSRAVIKSTEGNQERSDMTSKGGGGGWCCGGGGVGREGGWVLGGFFFFLRFIVCSRGVVVGGALVVFFWDFVLRLGKVFFFPETKRTFS